MRHYTRYTPRIPVICAFDGTVFSAEALTTQMSRVRGTRLATSRIAVSVAIRLQPQIQSPDAVWLTLPNQPRTAKRHAVRRLHLVVGRHIETTSSCRSHYPARPFISAQIHPAMVATKIGYALKGMGDESAVTGAPAKICIAVTAKRAAATRPTPRTNDGKTG